MNIDAITTDLVKQTLHAWQQALSIPEAWLQIDALPPDQRRSTIELGHHLHDLFIEQIIENLNLYRRMEEMSIPAKPPVTRSEMIVAITKDFCCHNQELEAWSALYHRYFALFPLSIADIAAAAPVTDRQIHRRIKAGLARLTELLQRAELEAHNRYHATHLRRHLPPLDQTQLFGIETPLEQAMTWLQNGHGSHFVSIEGIGGIGKTTLAQLLAYRLAEEKHWVDILWISARQHRLSGRGKLQLAKSVSQTIDEIVTTLTEQLGYSHLAGLPVAEKIAQLRSLLVSVPYLIVIDNLETVEGVENLLPALVPLAGATRFIFTSRHTMTSYGNVHAIPVKTLSGDDSRALLVSELSRLGNPGNVEETAVKSIYDTIGGLPLALKLTAAQMCRLPLNSVIQQLRQANRQMPDTLYSYIYRQSWQLLDDPARQLLLDILDISPDGELYEWLRLMSPLSDKQIEQAVSQLLEYSLLSMGRKGASAIYRLHRLTVTFLQTDILGGWSGGG